MVRAGGAAFLAGGATAVFGADFAGALAVGAFAAGFFGAGFPEGAFVAGFFAAGFAAVVFFGAGFAAVFVAVGFFAAGFAGAFVAGFFTWVFAGAFDAVLVAAGFAALDFWAGVLAAGLAGALVAGFFAAGFATGVFLVEADVAGALAAEVFFAEVEVLVDPVVTETGFAFCAVGAGFVVAGATTVGGVLLDPPNTPLTRSRRVFFSAGFLSLAAMAHLLHFGGQ